MGEPHDFAPRDSWHLSTVRICAPARRRQVGEIHLGFYRTASMTEPDLTRRSFVKQVEDEAAFPQGYAEGRQADAVGLLPGRAQRDAYRRTDAFRRHWSTDRPGGTGPADRRRAGDRYPRQCPGDRRGRTEPARLEGREASAVPDAEHAARLDGLTRVP